MKSGSTEICYLIEQEVIMQCFLARIKVIFAKFGLLTESLAMRRSETVAIKFSIGPEKEFLLDSGEMPKMLYHDPLLKTKRV